MKECTANDIQRLQDSLSTIRKAGGWTTEAFGEMIGLTKQSVSNLEHHKTPMSKTQYIAIRTVLDFEIAKRKEEDPENCVLENILNLCLNTEGLDDEDFKKAEAFVEGSAKVKLDSTAVIQGVAALIGGVAVAPIVAPIAVAATGATWLAKLLQKEPSSEE